MRQPRPDLPPEDLEPQGPPETVLYHMEEVRMTLLVRGSVQRQLTLGLLVLRCRRGPGRSLVPLSVALA